MKPAFFVASVKRAWHRELVSRPETHAWVLSLYRAGERHPETVLDYFPAEHAPSLELAAQLRRHRADESAHTRLYERAIAELEQPLEDHQGLDVFNNAIRAATPISFAIDERTTEQDRTLRLAHFLAHAFFLEQRIAQSLEYHLEACAPLGRSSVARVVERVHADELRHTSYTREAVNTLLGKRRAAEVLALHRIAEERANRAFSARQVRRFLDRFPHAGRKRERLLYAAGALIMAGGLPLV